jgi:hypothetical protein
MVPQVKYVKEGNQEWTIQRQRNIMNAIHSEVWLCLDANTEVPKRPPYQNSDMWMQVSSLPTNSSLQDTPRYQFTLKSGTIAKLTILLTAILKMVASLKWPWMQISALQTNSLLQNTSRYQFSLKSETINNIPILLAAILETVAS